MDDRIEHRVAIRAPLDRVWALVTTPGWWLPESAGRLGTAEPVRSPGRATVGWGREQHPWIIDVVRLEPQGYVSFRWASAFGGVAPARGTATLVELYLRQLGEVAGEAREVSVTVVESGFASLALPDALRDDQLTASAGIWQYELSGLRARAEQADGRLGGQGGGQGGRQGERPRNAVVGIGGRPMTGR